jgi:hypothetical protein
MSMVTVHGPNTMYTGVPGQGGSAGVAFSPGRQARAVQDPINGLKWTFQAQDSSRPAGDYSWAFPPDGTPSVFPGPGAVTVVYAAAGSKTGTLTVAGTNPAPPGIQNGTYPVVVTASAGQPRMVEGQSADEGGEQQAFQSAEPQAGVDVGYDPAAHTVDEVVEFAEEHPDQVTDIYAAEAAGKNRSTLLSHLEHMQG